MSAFSPSQTLIGSDRLRAQHFAVSEDIAACGHLPRNHAKISLFCPVPQMACGTVHWQGRAADYLCA
jgi:hypothetical protein